MLYIQFDERADGSYWVNRSLIVVINLLNRSFQGFDAGVAVDTPDR